MRSLCFAFLLTFGSAGAVTYDWRAEGLASSRVAEFRLWVAENPGATTRLLILVPGRNGDSRAWVEDPAWQAFARSRNCGLLGCRMQGDYYYVAGGWSGALLLKAVEELAVLSSKDELKDAGFALFGHSAGGQFACSFVDWRPERVLAFVACKGNFKEWNLDARKRAVPGLWIIGQKDSGTIFEDMTGSFCEGRRLGAPWALAVEPNGGHAIGPARELTIAFLGAVLSEPPGNAPWIGDLRTHEITPASGRSPDFRINAWLPNQTFAEAWKIFTGGVP